MLVGHSLSSSLGCHSAQAATARVSLDRSASIGDAVLLPPPPSPPLSLASWLLPLLSGLSSSIVAHLRHWSRCRPTSAERWWHLEHLPSLARWRRSPDGALALVVAPLTSLAALKAVISAVERKHCGGGGRGGGRGREAAKSGNTSWYRQQPQRPALLLTIDAASEADVLGHLHSSLWPTVFARVDVEVGSFRGPAPATPLRLDRACAHQWPLPAPVPVFYHEWSVTSCAEGWVEAGRSKGEARPIRCIPRVDRMFAARPRLPYWQLHQGPRGPVLHPRAAILDCEGTGTSSSMDRAGGRAVTRTTSQYIDQMFSRWSVQQREAKAGE